MFNDYKSCQIENSQKFVIFFKILEETIKCSERILLFSQSLLTLDLIEDFLHQRTVPGNFIKPYFLYNYPGSMICN